MTKEEAELYLTEELENYDDYREVTEPEIYDQRRWHTAFAQVVEHKPTKTFWDISWSRGSTEMQDDGVEDVEVQEVVPQEVTVIKYVAKKN